MREKRVHSLHMRAISFLGIWIWTVIPGICQMSGTVYYSDGNTLQFKDLVCLQTSQSIGKDAIQLHAGGVLKEYLFSELEYVEVKSVEGIDPGMDGASIIHVVIEIKTRTGRITEGRLEYISFIIVKIKDEETGKLRRKRIYFGKARALIIKKIEFD